MAINVDEEIEHIRCLMNISLKELETNMRRAREALDAGGSLDAYLDTFAAELRALAKDLQGRPASIRLMAKAADRQAKRARAARRNES